jgi:membrane-bound lytic murein transglycosylase D
MRIAFLMVLLFFFGGIAAQEAKLDSIITVEDSTLKQQLQLVADDEALFLVDMARQQRYEEQFFTKEQDNHEYVDSVLDPKTIEDRIVELNKQTPFELTYNPYVHAFINLYVVKKRDVTERIMGLAPYYFPMFEEALLAEGVPLELKYLAIVESALNPKAKSRAGALGLWQFMYRTGRMYGLQSTSYYDERMDPIKSTVAASNYLKDLYKIYGDWNLVIAAYNCGPGNVNKAIRRSGGKKDFWEIRAWLPRETRGYVPAFMAVNYVMNHGNAHGLRAAVPQHQMMAADTVMVSKQVAFETLSTQLNIDIDWLRYHNPMYRYDVIPETKGGATLCLPQAMLGTFLMNEDSLYAFQKQAEQKEQERAGSIVEPKGEEVVHSVRSGEVLGVIAQRYRCNVSEIREWNNLRSSRIYPGQKLTIYTNHPSPAVVKKEPVKSVSPQQPLVVGGKYKYHVVQPGDTLWDIAKKYEEVSVADLKRLNSNLNFKRLKPGDKIKVSKVG